MSDQDAPKPVIEPAKEPEAAPKPVLVPTELVKEQCLEPDCTYGAIGRSKSAVDEAMQIHIEHLHIDQVVSE